jgi:hypothetical protein
MTFLFIFTQVNIFKHMICENVSIFMLAPMIRRTFWQWNMENEINFVTNSKMNIPIQHCFFIFFDPLQNSYWMKFFCEKNIQ